MCTTIPAGSDKRPAAINSYVAVGRMTHTAKAIRTWWFRLRPSQSATKMQNGCPAGSA